MATVASEHHLSEKSLNWLQESIQINIDSRDGFKEAAEQLKDKHSTIESLFHRLAGERAMQASELQAMVASHAKEPEHSGSVSAAAHRVWTDLRSALGGGEHAVLAEAERGEDRIKGKYEQAIRELAGCGCIPTLHRQYAAVKVSHDTVRDLRDRCKKPK